MIKNKILLTLFLITNDITTAKKHSPVKIIMEILMH